MRVAINDMALDAKLEPGDSRWATFNDSFRNVDVAPATLLSAIQQGRAYTAWHEGRRRTENFLCGQMLVVDMDTDDERSTFEELRQNDMAAAYAGMMHTTASHGKRGPRARVLFFLDHPIEGAPNYKEALKFMWSQFPGADPACVDSSHFYFGAPGCETWTPGYDVILPIAQLREFYRRWKDEQKPRYSKNKALRPNDYRTMDVTEPVRRANNGTRNVTLNRMAFIAGLLVAEGRLEEWDIEQRLLSAALEVQLPEFEAVKTIRSGLMAGIGKGG